jgi:hypothetical protein
MECPGNPLDLHLMVQTVLRYYRATPHTSTDQTPYELIGNAPIPVMFPQLLSTQKSLQETHRHSIPKGKFGSARNFSVGDIVLVYDPVSKLNKYGIIKELKSNNSYIVDMDSVIKHISGDNMRLMQKVYTIDSAKDTMNNHLSLTNDSIDIDISDNESIVSDISDNESIVSDTSDFEFLNVNESNQVVNNQTFRNRKYRSELDKLNVGFNLPATRSRSGRM